MEWLLLLICPLMMIFMMFGMKGHGHKEQNSSKGMDLKMSNLELENKKLRNELDTLSALVKKES
ncbi:DUF2933 domain-containing protein [Niallia oryzisoli]|uniref:DUF2933 domain-containing protein n=1 Tax=Niallia oryzisoli TaxID=1737571 RepID=UPI003735511D